MSLMPAAGSGPCRQQEAQRMLNYAIRRLLIAVPTLLLISLVVFTLLKLAPGDPLADLPLTIPPEVREKIRSRSAPTTR